jgi:hypothetical protein
LCQLRFSVGSHLVRQLPVLPCTMPRPRRSEDSLFYFESPLGWLGEICDDVLVASEFNFFLELRFYPAQLPRRLVLFVLIQKGPKKSSQQKCFFAHKAFHAQIQKRCGLESFCRATLSRADPGCKNFLCPSRRTGRQRFRISPEAYLLTETNKAIVNWLNFIIDNLTTPTKA